MRALRTGDVLVVWKLDRLGRTLAHLVNTVQALPTRGVGLRVLTGQGAQIDTTTASGRLVFGIFAALAEFERELIRERTLAGLTAARAPGRNGGRTFALSKAQVRLAKAAMAHRDTSVSTSLSYLQSMIYSLISGAEEFAQKLLCAAKAKASAVARAEHPPVPTFADFATSSPPEGLIDDSAAVIELVLKHRLACDFMEQGDTRELRAIECEIKGLHHNARKVFYKLSESTQQEIRSIYRECQRGYDDFASINGKMAGFEEMLAWVQRGPNYRYTTALTEPHVPIGWCWSPPGTSEVKELPNFPDELVEWATKKFENAKPVRSLRETIAAEHDLQAARRPASSRNEAAARSRKAETKPSRRDGDAALPDTTHPRGLTPSQLPDPAYGSKYGKATTQGVRGPDAPVGGTPPGATTPANAKTDKMQTTPGSSDRTGGR